MTILIILGFIGLFHIFLAFIATKDIIDYPLFTTRKKTYWLILIWLIPFIGSNLYHRNVGYDWNSDKSVSKYSHEGNDTNGSFGE